MHTENVIRPDWGGGWRAGAVAAASMHPDFNGDGTCGPGSFGDINPLAAPSEVSSSGSKDLGRLVSPPLR